MQYPKFSVITPSYNQAQYLEKTIESVISQEYPNLEYIIIDGGSTDGSLEIIKKYSEYITYWISEKDSGQTEAINKGLKIATGDWIAWQNSDDIYLPGAFFKIAETIQSNKHAKLVAANMYLIDANGDAIRDLRYVTPTFGSLKAEGMILSNQASFWSKDVNATLGYLREDLNYAFDYEWFLRILQSYDAVHVDFFAGALRLHEATKTHNSLDMFDAEHLIIDREYGKACKLSKVYYLLRRLLLTAIQGNFRYIFRGALRRLNAKQ